MVSVWDVDSDVRLRSMASEHDYPLCLAFSPDGRNLAVAGKTRTIRIWDPVTGQQLLTLEGHRAQVNGLAFSPDGSVLASCSHDGAVRLWRSEDASHHRQRANVTPEQPAVSLGRREVIPARHSKDMGPPWPASSPARAEP